MGSTAFVLAFLLRFGGMTYPQFLTSDLGLHIHNVQNVLNGRWLFTEPLPDGTLVPYPNAFYVILGPFASVLGTSDEAIGLLLKWSGSLLDASTCLALAWVGSAAAAPFFLWVHLFDPHDPYDPPADLKRRFASAPYDGEIAAVDRLVGKIVAALGAQSTLERSIVVVAADHGEGLPAAEVVRAGTQPGEACGLDHAAAADQRPLRER